MIGKACQRIRVSMLGKARRRTIEQTRVRFRWCKTVEGPCKFTHLTHLYITENNQIPLVI